MINDASSYKVFKIAANIHFADCGCSVQQCINGRITGSRPLITSVVFFDKFLAARHFDGYDSKTATSLVFGHLRMHLSAESLHYAKHCNEARQSSNATSRSY